ncbi:MAG: 23S rRNA (guanosine(2251)-2'-O)-methyltransferase RlmB [Clostridiales bacterium]|nr:23S rRNA (guanosine(2251)-2'-O)-methyltransferase RlmB [Clostridiales bacterium]
MKKDAFLTAKSKKEFNNIDQTETKTVLTEGRNAVLELLKSDRSVDKLYVAKDAGGAIGGILKIARAGKVTIVQCDRRKLDSMSETKAHQGVIAVASEVRYKTIEDIFALAEDRDEKPLIVICDGITDPHNLGAIIRSAEVAGAHGIIIPKRRSAGVNAACAKAAAGALEYMPIVQATNLSNAITELKDRGVFLYGTDASGQNDVFETDLKGATAIVIGSEGEGMAKLTKELCDFIIRIPVNGRITSLNASAAAAVVLFESVRQRKRKV